MALLVIATACGSTAHQPDDAAVGSGGGGLSSPSPIVSGPEASATATSAPGSPTNRTTRATGDPVPPTVVATTAATTLRPATSGPGFTATQILIGVAYDSTLSQELGQAGASAGSATVGDQKRQVEAIVADINSRGGIAGRKVVPVFYDTNGLRNQNAPGTIAQAACSAWTEDRRVFAAMTYVVQMDNETLYSCLAKRHVVYVPLGGDAGTTLARYAPYLWAPPAITPERLAPVWVQRLAALGYFGGWDTTLGRAANAPAKIGLLYGSGVRNGQPELDKVFVAAVKKALAQQGRVVAAEFEVTQNQADEAAAVLRFKSAHVTHVIGDYSIVNFTQAAASQQYRPRYGFASFGGGVALKLFAPADQLEGALGVGWIPSVDVENEQDPGDVSPAAAHCRAVMERARQPTSSRLAWFAMTQGCDAFDFLTALIPASGFAPDAFPRAAAGLGAMPPASTFRIEFPNGRPDGAGAVRDVGYHTDCNCFTYLSAQDHTL